MDLQLKFLLGLNLLGLLFTAYTYDRTRQIAKREAALAAQDAVNNYRKYLMRMNPKRVKKGMGF